MPLPEAPPRLLLSLKEAGALLGVSATVIRAWIARGHLPAVRPGGVSKRIFIRPAELDRFLERSSYPPPPRD